VDHKEEACLLAFEVAAAEVPVVQGTDDRLARARRGNHQVAPVVAHLPLRHELLEDALLEGVGSDVKEIGRGVFGGGMVVS